MKDFTEYCKKREGDLVGSQLDNEDLIDYETIQKYWKDYVKLFLPVVTCSAEEAIILLKYYEEKCFTEVNGKLVLVRDEHLQKYNTYKNWLNNKELHYR
tara:strand:+ start:253 stop:549 length:297 start_codon:yes stop_codon:yes gene_type:complete